MGGVVGRSGYLSSCYGNYMGYGLWEWMLGMGSCERDMENVIGEGLYFFPDRKVFFVENFIIYRNGFLLKLFWIWGLSVFSFYLKRFERDLDVFGRFGGGIWTFFGRFLRDLDVFWGGFWAFFIVLHGFSRTKYVEMAWDPLLYTTHSLRIGGEPT